MHPYTPLLTLLASLATIRAEEQAAIISSLPLAAATEPSHTRIILDRDMEPLDDTESVQERNELLVATTNSGSYVSSSSGMFASTTTTQKSYPPLATVCSSAEPQTKFNPGQIYACTTQNFDKSTGGCAHIAPASGPLNCTNAPTNFDGNIQSFSPDPSTSCYLYDEPNCICSTNPDNECHNYVMQQCGTGRLDTIPVPWLAKQGQNANWNKRIRSWKCDYNGTFVKMWNSQAKQVNLNNGVSSGGGDGGFGSGASGIVADSRGLAKFAPVLLAFVFICFLGGS